MRSADDRVDVVVIGGGNAALCAALSARAHGARVLLLERAPAYMRGGNTRHTRDIRYAHDGADRYVTGAYTIDEFTEDVLRVTGGETNEELLALTMQESTTLPEWMESQGVRWQAPLRGTLHLARTNRFFLGGGKAMVNTYYDTAARLGVRVRYEATVQDLIMEDGRCAGVEVSFDTGVERIQCAAVIIASGGFEANISWHKEYWGDAADNFIIRGPHYNDGRVLAALLRHDVAVTGNPREFHAVCVDARSPRFDGGIVTRLDSVPFGIVVNQQGKRFYDEGEDLWPKRYAIWGGLVARQPGQIAYSIIDAQGLQHFMPSVFPPIQAESLPALAATLEREYGLLDTLALVATVEEYNRHTCADCAFDPSLLDGCGAQGLVPPKSHWARPIETPPFYAYPMRPGITFTYMGVSVDSAAHVLRGDGAPLENVFAAGEVMAGNILSRGYLAGFGLTIGTVFGRIAGREAGKYVQG